VSNLRIVVNVRHVAEDQALDLELPAEIPVGQLIHLLLRAFAKGSPPANSPPYFQLRLDSEKQPLPLDESLAERNVWDGAYLALEPAPAARPQATGARPAVLVSETGRSYPLSGETALLGRSTTQGNTGAENMIDLRGEVRGETVSRRHADIVFTNGAWFITPFKTSRNATIVNDTPVPQEQRRRLSNGDILLLGDVRLTFRIENR
jgi:pSer/pThr/pTyr-binding forkhead associated (FHA) protein